MRLVGASSPTHSLTCGQSGCVFPYASKWFPCAQLWEFTSLDSRLYGNLLEHPIRSMSALACTQWWILEDPAIAKPGR